MLKCLFCLLTHEDAEESHHHILNAHNKYFCVNCEGIFADNDKYRSHSCFDDDDDNDEEEDKQNNGHTKDLKQLNNDQQDPNLTFGIDGEKWQELLQSVKDNNGNGFVCFCGSFFSNKTVLSKHHSKTNCKKRKCVCGRELASIDSFLTHSCKKRSQVRKYFHILC